MEIAFARVFSKLSPAVSALVLTLSCPPLMAADVVYITGAGASFAAPLYQRWFSDYFSAHPDVRVNYQAIGSGAGLTNFINGRLDFAGSDVPMTAERAEQVKGGIVQLPLTAGAVVLAYHLPGIDALKLSREAAAGIFLGKVERWNDPIIAATNEGVDLPAVPITVVARAESSGTTFVATRHLSAISQSFASTVGTTMTPMWPERLKAHGALIRGHGNGGVAAYIKAIPGAIGYLQFAYAHLTNMQMASLQNQSGTFVPPDSESFKAAVKSFRAELDPSEIADPRAASAYPILTVSWLVARRDYDDNKARVLRDVIRYCLTEGQNIAERLGYVPLTEQAINLILQQTDRIQ